MFLKMCVNMTILLLFNLICGQSLREMIAKKYSVTILMQKVQCHRSIECYIEFSSVFI